MEVIEEVFITYLNVRNRSCLSLVKKESQMREYKRGQVVLPAGKIQEEIPFLLSGSYWCYATDSVGKRHMECLVDEKYFPMTPASDLSHFALPSPVSLETLEPTTAVCLPTPIVVRIVQAYPEVAEAMKKLVATSLQWHRHYLMWNSFPVPERYRMFCNMYPALSARLTKTAIAGILNTSLPVLSRALDSPQPVEEKAPAVEETSGEE